MAVFRQAAETQLTDFTAIDLNDRNYALNNGWSAYLDLSDSNVLQVWTSAPDSTACQVSEFSSDSELDASGSDGSLVFTHSSGRFFATPTDAVLKIGDGSVGRSMHVEGVWYVYVGSTLLRINQ